MKVTFSNYLKQAISQLTKVGIGTARLDVLVLLEDVTGQSRAWLLAHPEFELSTGQIGTLTNLLNRRAGHEPLAYIRGKAEFYGREFVLTPAVLQPRPESEAIIDLLKKHVKKGTRPYIADVGTGSGALGITAALELPKSQVNLLEIDSEALKIARTNVDKFTLPLNVIKSDLLKSGGHEYDVLLCNLPYVPDSFQINPAALQEPRLAIFGGPDGLDVYRKLFKQVGALAHKPLYILTEALPPQHSQLAEIADIAGYRQADRQDFIQLFVTA